MNCSKINPSLIPSYLISLRHGLLDLYKMWTESSRIGIEGLAMIGERIIQFLLAISSIKVHAHVTIYLNQDIRQIHQ